MGVIIIFVILLAAVVYLLLKNLDYYAQDGSLLVSITYKDGDDKDYSFYSPAWIKGIVRYKNAA